MTAPPNPSNAELDRLTLEHDAREGERVLQAVYDFLGRFVSFPSEHAHIAHALWCVHAHLMRLWDTTARLAFLSPEPASGKSRALEVTELLVPNPVMAVNVSPAYLFRKIGSEDGPPTVLFDEIDTVFGPKAKDGGATPRGYRREDFVDAWERYLLPLAARSATTATGETIEGKQLDIVADTVALVAGDVADGWSENIKEIRHVADVALVADFPRKGGEGSRRCAQCGGAPDGAEEFYPEFGEWLHPVCFRFWRPRR